MPTPAMTTKARILDAAEALFAESGIAAVSLRHITSRAGVNLAAVNYHFGSRDALIEAVYSRRLQPLNDMRLSRLERLEHHAGGDPPQLQDIIRAFIEPVLQVSGDADQGGILCVRLVAQGHTEHSEQFARFFSEQYGEVIARFTDALSRALPDHEPDELYWRLHFMIGATAYTIADDVSQMLARLEPFLVAGFSAPAR